ncbi:MAG: TIGR04211 family SH3 domain-containing protein [Thiohalomonadales bacterium]
MININYQLVTKILVVLAGIGIYSLGGTAELKPEKSMRYITDHQVVRIRAGRTNKDKIIKNVRSGTALELLGKKGKYSQVRTTKGLTGWILTIYLQKSPVAKVKLKEANKLLQQAKALNLEKDKSITKLTSRQQKLRLKYQQLEGNFTQLQDAHKKLKIISADAVRISTENSELTAETDSLQSQIKSLASDLLSLRDDDKKEWFINGAGVILIGVLLGLLLPKLRPKSRSSW